MIIYTYIRNECMYTWLAGVYNYIYLYISGQIIIVISVYNSDPWMAKDINQCVTVQVCSNYAYIHRKCTIIIKFLIHAW